MGMNRGCLVLILLKNATSHKKSSYCFILDYALISDLRRYIFSTCGDCFIVAAAFQKTKARYDAVSGNLAAHTC